MEHGFLANYSLENGTLPHGNTNYGKYHGNQEERCETYDGSRMLTGTGPDTWTHDHTAFGVEGLCGDIYEWMRGMRLMDGKLEIANNNDAAMPIDLSENSSDMNGERLPLCGGDWNSGSHAGVFYVYLYNPRSLSISAVGFRSAYYRKRKTE